MSNLQKRSITAVILFALLIGILSSPIWIFLIADIVLFILLMREFLPLVKTIFGKIIGAIYLNIACISLYILREENISYIIYLFVIVAATDIGAYFSGRAIGGTKLAPNISPNKTISGLIGGMICAAIASFFLKDGLVFDIILGAFFAIIAQIGDLLESYLKRKAGVKDSGNILPGHGGLFDRFDGVLAVAIIYGIVTLFL